MGLAEQRCRVEAAQAHAVALETRERAEEQDMVVQLVVQNAPVRRLLLSTPRRPSIC